MALNTNQRNAGMPFGEDQEGQTNPTHSTGGKMVNYMIENIEFSNFSKYFFLTALTQTLENQLPAARLFFQETLTSLNSFASLHNHTGTSPHL